MRARTSCQNTTAPKTQTTSPTTPHFQRFSPKWSAIWAPHRLKSRPRRHQLGELHYTSLRHAARRLRVVQTPRVRRRGGHRRGRRARAAARRGPGCGARGRQRGLAGLRGNTQPCKHRRCGGRRQDQRVAVPGRRPRAHKAARPGTTARGPLHPLRGAAPVTGRCTRSEGVHCLRIGCSAPNHKNKRGICETRARLRCPWAAAGPGRTTSRRAERSSRRGRLAGGPTPTGASSSTALSRSSAAAQHTAISRHSTSRRRGHPRR